jgi:hypothetical protein
MTRLTVLRACVIFWSGHALFRSIDCMGRVPGAAHCYQEVRRIDQCHLTALVGLGASKEHGHGGRSSVLCPSQPKETKAALLTKRDFACARFKAVAPSLPALPITSPPMGPRTLVGTSLSKESFPQCHVVHSGYHAFCLPANHGR